MFFNWIKEINRLRKEINRLLIKGMPKIYLKVTIEENWRSQNFNFLSGWNLSPGLFLRAPTHAVSLNFQTTCCKTVCGFSIILILKEIVTL